jgi:hypothetical protein
VSLVVAKASVQLRRRNAGDWDFDFFMGSCPWLIAALQEASPHQFEESLLSSCPSTLFLFFVFQFYLARS